MFDWDVPGWKPDTSRWKRKLPCSFDGGDIRQMSIVFRIWLAPMRRAGALTFPAFHRP